MKQFTLKDDLILHLSSTLGQNDVELNYEDTTINESNGCYVLDTKFYFREYIELDTLGTRYTDVDVELTYVIEIDTLDFVEFNQISVKHSGLELGSLYNDLLRSEIINSFDIRLEVEN